MERACQHCDLWQRDDLEPSLGICRSNPPQVQEADEDLIGVWPMTGSDDWCGNFQPRSGFRGTLAMVIDLVRELGCPLPQAEMNLAVLREWLQAKKE